MEDDPRLPLARFTKVDERGPYRDDGDPSWPGGGGPRYDVLHPTTGKPCTVPSRGWVWPTYERMKEIDTGNIVFGPDEKRVPSIRRNLFEKDEQECLKSSCLYRICKTDLEGKLQNSLTHGDRLTHILKNEKRLLPTRDCIGTFSH